MRDCRMDKYMSNESFYNLLALSVEKRDSSFNIL